ncbi:hypothetical protein [Candidatus Solirubrobacter pratensis]|uniref:hypothetical protein n=1 Tax=Candidatus Solirubrobacter pratensis TaxID=1298857 RepID=UPI00055E64D1|nr:hypothetical protein [Candidatus Solirubrobacter pratensis]
MAQINHAEFMTQLILWDELDDPYSHGELVQNWNAVASHNHTTGQGVKIPGGGIEDNAIGAQHIANGALPGSKLQDHSVDLIKASANLLAGIIPLGVALPWTRLHPSQPIPAGPGTLFEVPRGQTLQQGEHNLPGVAGSVTLPNWTDRFVFYTYAADGSGTQVFGGANFRNLSHSHAVAGHTHPIPAHRHQVDSHAHRVSGHTHVINADGFHGHGMDPAGDHTHTWNADNGSGQHLASRRVGDPSPDGIRQALYIPGFNSGDTSQTRPMNGAGNHVHGIQGGGIHSHGGHTGGMDGDVFTESTAPFTTFNVDALLTQVPSAPVSTDGQLPPNFDMRAAYVTVIPIMRVRNP